MSGIALPYGVMMALSLTSGPLPVRPADTVVDTAFMGLAAPMQTATFTASKFAKWQQVNARYQAQAFAYGSGVSVPARAWSGLVTQVRSAAPDKRLEWVNRAINHIRYVPDSENWGSQDYWATPIEFLSHGGDCEDYAIAKYQLLIEAGVPADSMEVAISENHAFLVVQTEQGPIVLDNQRSRPYRLKAKTAKKVLFTINDQRWIVSLG